MEMQMQYPGVGWKFDPTNLEIITFLSDHVRRIGELPGNVITQLDLYETNLWMNFDRIRGDPNNPNTKYVVVTETNFRNSTRVIRRTGGNFRWRDKGHRFDIQNDEGILVGLGRRMKLVRMTGVPTAEEAQTTFLMTVFSLQGVAVPPQGGNTVICRLRKVRNN